MDTNSIHGWNASDNDPTTGDQGPAGFSWNFFLVAAAIALIAMNWGFLKPASRQLDTMSRQIATLESTIEVLTKQHGSAQKSMNLIEVLAKQGVASDEAAESLARISELNDRLVDEAGDLGRAQTALTQLSAIQGQLARNSQLMAKTVQALADANRLQERVIGAAAGVAESETALNRLADLQTEFDRAANRLEGVAPIVDRISEVHDQLAGVSSSTKQAKQAAEDLISLARDLDAETVFIEQAEQGLNALTGIRQALSSSIEEIASTQTKIDELVKLKDSVLARTTDVPEAIEALEQASDLNEQFTSATKSFDQIRRWMGDVILMEPTVKRAMETLEPITQLGVLRRMSPHELQRVVETMRQSWSSDVGEVLLTDETESESVKEVATSEIHTDIR